MIRKIYHVVFVDVAARSVLVVAKTVGRKAF